MVCKLRVRFLSAALAFGSLILATPASAAPLEALRPPSRSFAELVDSLLMRLWDTVGTQIDPDGAPLAPEEGDGQEGDAGNQMDPDGARDTEEVEPEGA